jgi:hypothetical protein
MGKGLSSLQHDILGVLENWPSFEDATLSAPGSIGCWAKPGDIIQALGRSKSPASRAAMSKALLRLHQRGLVARAAGEVAAAGMGFRYVRVANPANAGAGNDGPAIALSPRPRMRAVRSKR